MKKARRRKGYQILAAFYRGKVCDVCGKPYDPYQDVSSSPRASVDSDGHPVLEFGFVHEGCDKRNTG